MAYGEPTGFIKQQKKRWHVYVEGGARGLGLEMYTGGWWTKAEANKAVKAIEKAGYKPILTDCGK